MGREKNPARIGELSWCLTRQIHDEAMQTLFGNNRSQTNLDEKGFLGLIYSGSGSRSRSLFLTKIVKQEMNWVYQGSNGLAFDSKYFSRALDQASMVGPDAGIIIVHSHPFPTISLNSPPHASSPDLKHERRLLYYLNSALPSKAPLASGIVSSNGAWRIREYSWDNTTSTRTMNIGVQKERGSRYRDVSKVRIVSSDRVDIFRYDSRESTVFDEKAVDSTLRLWGKVGQEILSRLRIGIAGVGGVGSILVEYLARLGVGELVLVDFDLVERENLNRLVGARSSDVGKPKVVYARRVAKNAATSNGFKVITFRGSAAENEGLRRLLDADIIMNAADSAFARQVLDHASYAYEVPVIDGGSVFVPDAGLRRMRGKSQVTVAGPGLPCLECTGVYSQEEATQAREDPSESISESYIKAGGIQLTYVAPRNPSVISYNGLVASLMVQRMLGLTLGFPPEHKVGQQRYYVEEGVLNWAPIDKCKIDCSKQSWTGLGDSHYVPVGIDPIWKRMRS